VADPGEAPAVGGYEERTAASGVREAWGWAIDEFGANNGPQALGLAGFDEGGCAIDSVAVGEGQGVVTQRLGLARQSPRRGGAEVERAGGGDEERRCHRGAPRDGPNAGDKPAALSAALSASIAQGSMAAPP